MYYKQFYITTDFLGVIAYQRGGSIVLRSRTLNYMLFLIDNV
jgi:hypothetical protein